MNKTLFHASALTLSGLIGLGWAALPGRAAGYSDAVLNDKPLAYYRFNDSTQRVNLNLNSGTLAAPGNATNLNVHLIPGAIAGSRNAATYFDSTASTIVPWNAVLNPNATNSFTIEAWFYPTSDAVAGAFSGPAPLMNRYSYSGVDRQGWVYFQRNPDSSYATDGQTDVGWNFRTYLGSGSTVGMDITSQVPYKLGQWQQVVTVWDGPNQTATMYIDGTPAATNAWSGNGPAYVANTDDHPASEAANGPAGLAIGSYNNTEPGSNPFRGAIDEVALYPKALTSAQIQAHYQNATNSARSTPYEALVQSDGPVGYWRMDDPPPGPDVAINMGLLQSSGTATNLGQVQRGAATPIVGTTSSSYAYHWRNNGSATTDMPWTAQNNPDASVPFTFEAWFRPMNDQQNPGPSPINNRLAGSAQNRTGWVIYQRAPNSSYGPDNPNGQVSGFEGVGWTFRMYTGSGSGGQDVVSNVPYIVGNWQYVVVTWDGTNTQTMYIDGNPAATNSGAAYAANTNPPASPDDSLAPADLAIGSYNAASGFGENFEGEISDVALYTNVVLTATQIMSHYQVGTNSHRATNYETLVLSAPYDGAGTQALQPATYLRLNEPASYSTANSGSLGDAAVGSLIATANTAAGPQPPTYSGFETSNLAMPLDGTLGRASLNDPAGLNFSGRITLEAWINPAATQGATARIISHGPPTLSNYDSTMVPTNGAPTVAPEVFLRLENQGALYAVGSSDGTNVHEATFSVPAGDLGGGKWIHLVGTYDGSNWVLFRNGTQAASAASTSGALPVTGWDWAIGSTGQGWADNFAGAIDEVAIYDSALSPARVQAHYAAGTSTAAAPTLGISLVSSKVVLTWNSGTLQQAIAITGTFADVPGAASPYTVVGNSVTGFYRVRQ